MRVALVEDEPEIKCPECNSGAYYKYGRTKSGKQRFVCLMCKRQFSLGGRRAEIHNRPICPECGKPMHFYKRERDGIRFRCSNYPECRKYIKK